MTALWSDGSQSSGSEALPELVKPAPRRRSGVREALSAIADRLRGAQLQPLLAVGLLLIAAGFAWALPRGLAFYGLDPVKLVYDLDQPPVLLALVGVWLIYRSRRR
jgi:hypothetical protein